MSAELANLIQMLKSNPGYVFITPDGTRLFALVGPEEKLMVATCLVKNFNDMTEDEVNQFIQNLLS